MDKKINKFIDILCFLGVFAVMSNLISNEEALISRLIYSILLVWAGGRIFSVIKTLYNNQEAEI